MDRKAVAAEGAKAAYESPTLAIVGTFESITQSAQVGSRLDADFPAGTHVDDLTFS